MTQTPIPPIPIDDRSRLLVLTGAGISAESGLATFRGSGGLWEGSRVEDVATPEAFEADPVRVWRFYSERRSGASAVQPNAAHLALAEAERRMGDRFLLATQNVDGLHGRAGSRRLVEVHGSLARSRCSRCGTKIDDMTWPVEPPLPTCAACFTDPAGPALMRPDIVWFGELLDPADEWRIRQFVASAERAGVRLAFLAIGTSGNVWPAAGYVRYAKDFGAETWLANMDPATNEHWFDHVVTGPATRVVPALLGVV
jgi:NAD-dependent deacetylase